MAYNAPIAVEFVPLVRRLLMESEMPLAAHAGQVGEITYLVLETLKSADIEILDLLAASLRDKPRGTRPVLRMQQRRDALAPLVGRQLLRVGLVCASRQYEVYVDPRLERLVDASGLATWDPPDFPADASPVEQARWIFDNPSDDSRGDGERAVNLLLSGREPHVLTLDELLLLAKGYNWWGQHARSLETMKQAVSRRPHEQGLLRLAGLYAWNAYGRDLPQYLTACDRSIAEGCGPPAFWHLLKADYYIRVATGEHELEEYDWSPGSPLWHPELLAPAAVALAAALAMQPNLREDESARGWVGDWDLRFAAVLQQPEYEQLR
jgi:hypothetical protein